jgi:replication factor A1
MISDSTQKFKKGTAYKLSISDIVKGKFIKIENRSYVTTPFGLNINRVRIFGIIVDKKIFKQDQNEENIDVAKKDYAYLVIDDGTETIRIKTWGADIDQHKLPDLNIGENLDVIGKVREYNEEIFIMPEIIHRIKDPNLELLRELEKIELKKLFKDKKIVNMVDLPKIQGENITPSSFTDEKKSKNVDFNALNKIKIKDLTPNSKKINLIGKIVEMEEIRQTSNNNKVMDALLSDETGSVFFTVWNENIEKIKTGESYLIINGYMSSFQNKLYLNTGKFGEFRISNKKIQKINADNNISLNLS